MALLRRTLYWHAAFWAACGVGVIAVPRWALETVLDHPGYVDLGYVRVAGAMSIGFALVMVLVAQRIEDVWWWSWAFAITDAGIVTITLLEAVFGDTAPLLWWLFVVPNALLATALLVGLARAGQEKPFA
jgi:hypothetical protein